MNNEKTVGSYSIIIFIINIIMTKIFLSAPMIYVKHSGGAGWIEVALCGILELFILAIIIKLLSRFENFDLLDIVKNNFGRIWEIIIGTLATVIFLANSAAVFRSFCEVIRNSILQGFSYEYIGMFILAVIIFAAYLGIKSQLRFNNLIFPIVALALIITALVNTGHYNITNTSPVLGYGIDKIVFHAVLKNASFFEIGAIIFLLPYLRAENRIKKIGFTALAIATLLLSLITLLYQLTFPYEAASNFELPLYQMTRMLRTGFFMQRLEPLNMFVWSGTFFVYIGFGLWLASYIFSRTYKLNSEKPIIFLFAETICIMSLIPGSETTVELIFDFILSYAYIIYPVIPLAILLIAAAIRRRRRGRA